MFLTTIRELYEHSTVGREAVFTRTDSVDVTMNVPVPRNRLVALTLFGVVFTGLVSVTLAAPNLLPGDDGPDSGQGQSDALASDAPTPNENFTPAVQSQGGDDGEDEEEHEEYEDEDDEHDESEHDEDEED